MSECCTWCRYNLHDRARCEARQDATREWHAYWRRYFERAALGPTKGE